MARVEKKARGERRVIVCVDEAGFYLLPGVVRTYAPGGETPLLKALLQRDHLSMLRGVTPCGQLATVQRRRALTGAASGAFLRHLCG